MQLQKFLLISIEIHSSGELGLVFNFVYRNKKMERFTTNSTSLQEVGHIYRPRLLGWVKVNI